MDLTTLDERLCGKLIWYQIPLQELELYQTLAQQYTGVWVDYERYMKAGLLNVQEGQTGVLLVKFEHNTGIEKLGFHRHPASDRQIVILEGTGQFHYGFPLTSLDVSEGIYLEFPRGTVHTFTTTEKDMIVLSIHRPFIALGDEECLEMYIK